MDNCEITYPYNKLGWQYKTWNIDLLCFHDRVVQLYLCLFFGHFCKADTDMI